VTGQMPGSNSRIGPAIFIGIYRADTDAPTLRAVRWINFREQLNLTFGVSRGKARLRLITGQATGKRLRSCGDSRNPALRILPERLTLLTFPTFGRFQDLVQSNRRKTIWSIQALPEYRQPQRGIPGGDTVPSDIGTCASGAAIDPSSLAISIFTCGFAGGVVGTSGAL
jgi:hypothetical protein